MSDFIYIDKKFNKKKAERRSTYPVYRRPDAINDNNALFIFKGKTKDSFSLKYIIATILSFTISSIFGIFSVLFLMNCNSFASIIPVILCLFVFIYYFLIFIVITFEPVGIRMNKSYLYVYKNAIISRQWSIIDTYSIYIIENMKIIKTINDNKNQTAIYILDKKGWTLPLKNRYAINNDELIDVIAYATGLKKDA